MQIFRKRSWSLSQESDSEEVDKFGVPELKLVLKLMKHRSRSRKSELEKNQGPDLVVDERRKSVYLVESEPLHQLH